VTSQDQSTLKLLFDQSVQRFHTRPALARVNGESLTYAVIYNRVQALAQNLADHGVQAGDRVAIYSENKPNWTVAFFAIISGAAIAVPISTDTSPQNVKRILKHNECKALFISRRLLDKLGDVDIKSLQTVILIDHFQSVAMEGKKDFFKDLLEKGEKEWTRLKKAALQMTGKIFVQSELNFVESSPVVIFHTSGREGLPRPVMLTHRQLLQVSDGLDQVMKMNEYDRLLSLLPLAKASACVFDLITPFRNGSCVYFPDNIKNPAYIMDAMSAMHPTLMLSHAVFMNSVYADKIAPALKQSFLIRQLMRFKSLRRRRELKLADRLRLSFGGQLRMLALAGSALSSETQRFLDETAFKYSLIYGLTEAGGVVSISGGCDGAPGSVGKPLAGIEVRIDEEKNAAGNGEISLRGGSVITGYYSSPEITKQFIDSKGWLKTGDYGFLDKNGYLYLR
jgi:long-chain acyl-CoA synthetase